MTSGTAENRAARVEDAEAIRALYNHFVATSIVTFDIEPRTLETQRALIAAADAEHPWLVRVEGGQLVGYAHTSSWKSRCAYSRTVESTLYIRPESARRGHGLALYRDLLERVRAAGVHTVLGGIAVPNQPSVRMHELLGFERVGVMREVGWKFDRWIDVEYWQLRLV